MNMVPDENRDKFFSQSAELLTAMANGVRFKILTHIIDNETSVSSLCEMLGLAQSATSQHLAKLRDAGLVSTRRDAQTVYYFSRSQAVFKILQLLDEIEIEPIAIEAA